MARGKTGSVLQRRDKTWWARITYQDEQHDRREKWRRARNKSDARDLVKEMLRELEDHGEKSLSASRKTFKELEEFFRERYVMEPKYNLEGRKIAGLRSYRTVREQLQMLGKHFGSRRLRSITHGDIEAFKLKRLETETKRGKPRSIARLNRELALLRRVLNVANRQGWILQNPFAKGDSLISIADENKRQRILNLEEESRLLAQCQDRRSHLKPIVICALDTGMRQGEIFKLQKKDINFADRIITVCAFNTKTMRERKVGMTPRLEAELTKLFHSTPDDPSILIFGIKTNVKRSFNQARRAAGLTDVRFHDLRHTCATRLASRLPLAEVGRILGHTQPSTTYRYVNANEETLRRAAQVIASFSEDIESRQHIIH